MEITYAAHAQVAWNSTIIDQLTGLLLTSRRLRTAVLALCIGREGYLFGRGDGVWAHANRDVAAFFNLVLFS